MYSVTTTKKAVRIITPANSDIQSLLEGFEIKITPREVEGVKFLWATTDTPEKLGFVLGVMMARGKHLVSAKEWKAVWAEFKAKRDGVPVEDEGSEVKSKTKKTKKTVAKKSTSKKAPAKKSTTKKAAAKKAA